MGLRSKTAKTKRGATRRAKTGGRTKTAKAKLTKPTAEAVRQIVKTQLMRVSETKYVSSYAADTAPNTYTTVDSAITGATQWSYALPPLSQSTTQSSSYTRVGNLIMPRQVKVALDVRLKGGTSSLSTPVDITVVIFYGHCKKYTKFDDVQNNSATLCAQLLKLGGINAAGAESQAFNGIQSDYHLPFDTDVWKLRSVKFRLHKCAGYLNGTASPGTLGTGAKNNHALILDWGSTMPEQLKFDTDADTRVENWSPVFSIGYYYNDGTPPDTGANAGIVEYKANKILTFKDF